ncbi:MAG TPA: HlyD family secretion protein [Stellaceae bacterium]|nr:HlyD family secretion protein [Stellaceae bacterium]
MRPLIKRLVLAVGAIAAVTAGGYYGHEYWTVGRFLQTTDDAYLQADYTTIAPKVSGYIAEVLVDDNQPVKAGEVLARIDDRDFKAALAQANADVDAGKAAISNAAAQIEQQHLVIDQARSAIDMDQAVLRFAQEDQQRYAALARTGAGSVARAQETQSNLQQRQAALRRDQAALGAAQQQVTVLQTQLAEAQATLEHAKAVARQAELNLGYTTITAPLAGTVGARSLRVGQYVQAGTQLMAVVPLQSVYVVGNFKETQLTDVRAGQPATLTVDSFPGAEIHGRVDSLSPASGLEFALLPPDNATGNFTKIVQRIPVKITVDADDPLLGRLRAGMSVEATIDTKATVLAERRHDTALAER